MFTYPIGLLAPRGAVEAILVTMTPTVGYTVGFNLAFTGSVFIDFKDGGGKEALTSGVEKTHLYASAGTYIAEITGDLENIIQFIATNNRITSISNLKTGLLINLSIGSNLILGILDLSNAPISGIFQASNNSGITQIIHASTGNGLCTNYQITSLSITSLDLSNVPISGIFNTAACSNLSSITFASSGNGTITLLYMYSCNLNSLDLSNLYLTGQVRIYSNPNLSSLLLGSSNGSLTLFRAYICNLPNIDFTVFTNIDSIDIRLNNYTSTEHDNQLINLDSTGWINKTLNIITGNAARTSASDTAYNNLISKGWTIT